jgi:uncharacterized protein (DUF433 family)
MRARTWRNERHDAFRGAYDTREVASYFRAADRIHQIAPSRDRLRAWARNGALRPTGPVRDGRRMCLDFDDLTTSQVIAILRSRGWSFARIRKAELAFAELLGTPRPFANRAFWTMGPDLLARVGGSLVVGTRGGQLAFEDLVRDWLDPVGRHFGFDEATGQAAWWKPVDFVRLDPGVQFGAPCVEGTGVPTSALWSYVRGGDPIPYVADSYGLSVADVERAVAWEDRRRRALGAAA